MIPIPVCMDPAMTSMKNIVQLYARVWVTILTEHVVMVWKFVFGRDLDNGHEHFSGWGKHETVGANDNHRASNDLLIAATCG